MRFNFIHGLPRKGKQRRWYDNPFWGPLSIAMIGAFIVAFAQITTTILPIYFGPSDACDFSIALEPFSDTVTIDNNTSHIEKNITVKDLHSIIKPYHHPVYVKIIGPIPKGVTVSLDGKGGLLPLNIKMTIEINEKEYDPGDHEIKIQGIGEDGITRNCIYFLNLKKGHREYNFTTGTQLIISGKPEPENEFPSMPDPDPTKCQREYNFTEGTPLIIGVPYCV